MSSSVVLAESGVAEEILKALSGPAAEEPSTSASEEGGSAAKLEADRIKEVLSTSDFVSLLQTALAASSSLPSPASRSSAPMRRGKQGKMQKKPLEELFAITQNPSKEERKNVAEKAGLTTNQVTKWFQNQRYRVKRAVRGASEPSESTESKGEAPEAAVVTAKEN
ncbi:hypothetical protein QR680_004879 [Steinernema hermaphroditum]|uniref:Homeobox domain-containing protein n=1 Tax=Steinernema hermaphroditum TaxID=289476 RepID=A0AA39LUE1_9BILA|nr:hypothetical protein QR680_004879 [Steinernema hermaphroditum]